MFRYGACSCGNGPLFASSFALLFPLSLRLIGAGGAGALLCLGGTSFFSPQKAFWSGDIGRDARQDVGGAAWLGCGTKVRALSEEILEKI